MPTKLTQQQVIQKMIAVHGNTYDYSKVEYVNSTTKVEIRCSIHGSFLQSPGAHTFQKQGCPGCRMSRITTTITNKYGVQYASQIPSKIEKTKQVLLAKYGHENAAHGAIAKQKIEQTNLERYGHVKAAAAPIVRERIRATCLDKYGVPSVLHVPDIQEKCRQTSISRYGAPNPLSNGAVLAKAKATLLANYGVDHPLKAASVKVKRVSTCLERYGVPTASQVAVKHVLHLLTDYDWMYDQYVTQQKTAEIIGAELGVGDTTVGSYLRKCEITIKSINQYSYKCISWLNAIAESEQIVIQHAGNGGEFCIPTTRYKADGYCAKTNTVYEFNGDVFHGNPALFEAYQPCHPFSGETAGVLHQRTLNKANKIKSLGYNLISIWENDYVTSLRV